MAKKLNQACVLAINGGSSSIKFALYQVGEPLERGLYGKVDRIGLSGTNLMFHDPDGKPQASRRLRSQIGSTFPDGLVRRAEGLCFGQGRGTPSGAWHDTFRAGTGHTRVDG